MTPQVGEVTEMIDEALSRFGRCHISCIHPCWMKSDCCRRSLVS